MATNVSMLARFHHRNECWPATNCGCADPDDGGLPHSILLAEDELLVRLCIAQELRDVGYIVHEAADADEALSIVGKENVELLITDIRCRDHLTGWSLPSRFAKRIHKPGSC